jgi:hypothetical protein
MLKKASSLLTENGLLAISHKGNRKTEGRQHIPVADLISELENGFEILLRVESKWNDESSFTSEDDQRDDGAFRIVAQKSKKL